MKFDKNNKMVESSKRNAMGIGASLTTIITWGSTTFFGVVIPPEVAVAIASVILMVLSEIKQR